MDLRALKDRADTLFARGRFTDCAQVYRKILQHEPLDPRLHLRLAESLRRGPKPEEAIGCYRAAAAILTRSGHLSKARATLKMALELAPDHPVLLLALDTLDERLQPCGPPLPDLPPPCAPARARPSPPFRPREIPLDENDGTPPPEIVRDLAHRGAEASAPAKEGGPCTANLRRISEYEIAVRTPGAGWMILYSMAPIMARHLGPSGNTAPANEELMSEEVFQRVHGNR